MLKYIKGITNESVIEVAGTVKAVDRPIDSCSAKDVEIEIKKIYVVNRSTERLPLLISDASTVFETLDEVKKLDEE
jgi:aspartyl-tRNA synthetase